MQVESLKITSKSNPMKFKKGDIIRRKTPSELIEHLRILHEENNGCFIVENYIKHINRYTFIGDNLIRNDNRIDGWSINENKYTKVTRNFILPKRFNLPNR